MDYAGRSETYEVNVKHIINLCECLNIRIIEIYLNANKPYMKECYLNIAKRTTV